MEKKFESLSLFEFQDKFKTDADCYQYLFDIKWKDKAYQCRRCGNSNACVDSQNKYTKKCTKCQSKESSTAHTLFHKLKFPILKAFWIIYLVATNKKGISSCELSRKLSLRQKTCWSFKRKVMEAMKSSGNYLITKDVEVDETHVGGKEEGKPGRSNGKKQKVVVAIEKSGAYGVKRMYAKVITKFSKDQIGGFMQSCIEPTANVKTDGWQAYKGLKDTFKNLVIEKSEKGKNYPTMHRCIMMLKAWLRGTHHSVKNLQPYLDEYTYRLNRHFMKKGLFENLVLRMMNTKPLYQINYNRNINA